MDGEFFAGEEVRVGGVFGFEVVGAPILEEAFEGGFAVDEGGDDVAGGGWFFFEDDDVSVFDAGADHALAFDFDGEGFFGIGDADGAGDEAEGMGGLFGLASFDGVCEACGNGVEEGELEGTGGVVWGAGGEEASGAGFAEEEFGGFEFFDDVGDGAGAGEAAVVLDFADGGGAGVFFAVVLDEVEDHLLGVCQFRRGRVAFGHDTLV